jgi:two-component system osmolarity sensor histidine kinase EnvZ
MFLKRFAPKSLYGRFLMIIILPTVLVQLVATYMFYERHWESVNRSMVSSLSGEIHMALNALNQASSNIEQRSIIERNSIFLGLNISIDTEAPLYNQKCNQATKCLPNLSSLPKSYKRLYDRLTEIIEYPLLVINDNHKIIVKVKTDYGLVSMVTTNKRLTNPTTYIFIMWMSGSAIVLLLVAILFLKNQVRSITRLAKAAEKFGKGEELEKFKPEGAQEVRQAATAFLEMKDRIQRHITQRMEMLAGISHDLRTPLTRMKLELALLNNPEVSATLEEDVDEMEMMLEEYMDFVRGAGQEEKQEVKLSELLEDIISSYNKMTKNIILRIGEDGKASLRPVAIKRCLTNIINNALRYSSRIIVSADIDKKNIRIAVDDNGPGVPKELHEKMFRPFVKLDESRTDNDSGAGLGLAIVKDIVSSHGGEIKVEESSLGGLRILINIPT